ncbi:hypothetical protein [Parvibaculum sp.]|jgi:hypothetical protein|uniref:hypothetical protein n=1 Tax=Parvibaculum sp. TaxID=2024848 RepID=UPI001B14B83D|nr:hypothetical protein [Parvibaculum sp.]MBO6633623.1 hypothetical protein [Parvibaculum sp.]MBO6679570.1 hypothetical protein [Parvibaculum sp.]
MTRIASLLSRRMALLGAGGFACLGAAFYVLVSATPAYACNGGGNYNFNENWNFNYNENHNTNSNTNTNTNSNSSSFTYSFTTNGSSNSSVTIRESISN